MKNSLTDIYEQILLNEAEKSNLQNPSQDEIGNLKSKQDLFGSKPKPVEGPEKANLQKGPAYKETIGSSSKPTATKTTMSNSAPAKQTNPEKGKEMKDTDVDPTNEEEEEEDNKSKKKEVKEEGFTLSAFEALFKKTLTEETEETEETIEEESDEELSGDEETEEELEEEGDLISDLRDLQDKLSMILSKLEDTENTEEEGLDDESTYSEEDFDEEFSEEDEEAMKESIDKPKALNNSKGKILTSKKNKVGKVHPKGGKANGGKLKNEPNPKALGDKKSKLQKGKPEVKSSVKKGDFIR